MLVTTVINTKLLYMSNIVFRLVYALTCIYTQVNGSQSKSIFISYKYLSILIAI